MPTPIEDSTPFSSFSQGPPLPTPQYTLLWEQERRDESQQWQGRELSLRLLWEITRETSSPRRHGGYWVQALNLKQRGGTRLLDNYHC